MMPPAGVLLTAACRGALGGACCAIGLAAGETLLGALGGQADNATWLARLAGAYLPALMMAGAASGTIEQVLSRSGARAPSAALLTFQLLLLLHTAAVTLQESLPGLPLLATPRLLALALTLGLAIAGLIGLSRAGARLGWLAACAMSFGVPVTSCVATLAAPGLARQVSIVALPMLGMTLIGWSLLLAARGRRTKGGWWLLSMAGLLIVSAFLLVRASDALPGRARFEKSERQPDPVTTSHNSRPNVVLIVLDTLRAQSLSCYGYGRPSPHIDAFAREAVLYSNFVTTAPWTLPAHASLFTGLYAGRHGTDRASPPHWRPGRGAHPLEQRFETLAEMLSRVGYATAGIASNFTLDRTSGLDQGFREYDASPAIGYTSLLARVAPRLPHGDFFSPIRGWLAAPFRSAASIARTAEEWLSSRPRDQPYFLFLNFMDAHAPYVTRLDLREWTLAGGGSGLTAWGLPEETATDVLSGRRALSPVESSQLVARYDGAVAYLDRELGQLLDHLRGRHDYHDTWIILLADHGEALGEHRTLGHGLSLFQEVLLSPLIVKYPRSVPSLPGTRDDRPVQTVDILPTLLDGLGLRAAAELDGVPIRLGREWMFAEASIPPLADAYPARFHRQQHAAFEGSLKYIEGSDGQAQLYDLAADPGEEQDVSVERPAETARLRDRLRAWRLEMATRRSSGPRAAPAPQTESQRERLRALGYVR